MQGIYFYKLVSPYSEDVTKDCKLTINEIDHNFITLKDADIVDAIYHDDRKVISFVKNNGEELQLDMSKALDGVTKGLTIDYDRVDGVITIDFNGERVSIDGLITDDNLYTEALTEVINDGTLHGTGTSRRPLGIANVEKTGTYRPAIRLIDRTNGEFMPHPKHLEKGDRYVTLEKISDYGYLYPFDGVKKIDEDLKCGWRIPTKDDWDNMLNAIEPCDEFRNHDSALANNMLGKIAGKLLKSKETWKQTDECIDITCDCEIEDEFEDTELFDVFDGAIKKRPMRKKISPNGVDSFGMRLTASGFYDGCDVVDYFGKRGIFWSKSVINESDVYVKRFDYNKAGVIQNVESPRNYFSVRLVKDYDGSNHRQIEFINGMNYRTVLMPSLNTKYGFSIWTCENIAFPSEKYRPINPNNGEGLSFRKVYYINEWNGFDWDKKQLTEGESIVLMTGLNGEHNIEYRVMNGVLYSEAATIYDKIMEEIKPEIDRIDKEIDDLQDVVGEGFVNENGDRITITDKVDEIDKTVGSGFTDENGEKITITDKLASEIEERIAADEQLKSDLEAEIERAIARENELEDAIEQERAEREEADTALRESIEQEKTEREEADKKLQESIDKIEESVGLSEDGEYVKTEGNYTSEANTIAEAIDLLDKSLKSEEESRIEKDEELQNELDLTQKSVGLNENGEYVKRTDSNYINDSETIADSIDKLDSALKQEETDRVNMDNYLHSRLIKAGEQPNEAPNIAYDCANGVLTLYTEDPSNNVIIKLNGDYGIFPYKENV